MLDSALTTFFAAYLSQDFDLEFNSIWDALEDFVANSTHASSEQALVEVRAIRSGSTSEQSLGQAFNAANGGNVDPREPGQTWLAWFEELDNRLTQLVD